MIPCALHVKFHGLLFDVLEPICGKYFFDGSFLEKCGNMWENCHFSGRLRPDWRNTTGLGSKGLRLPAYYFKRSNQFEYIHSWPENGAGHIISYNLQVRYVRKYDFLPFLIKCINSFKEYSMYCWHGQSRGPRNTPPTKTIYILPILLLINRPYV